MTPHGTYDLLQTLSGYDDRDLHITQKYNRINRQTLIIYWNNIQTPPRNHQKVRILIQNHDLHVNIDKTFLSKTEINYLGYKITTTLIRPHHSKFFHIEKFNKTHEKGTPILPQIHKLLPTTMEPPKSHPGTTHQTHQQQH